MCEESCQKAGLQLIELHYYHMPENSEANQFADFGPADFLAYIKNAEMVSLIHFTELYFQLYIEDHSTVYIRKMAG